MAAAEPVAHDESWQKDRLALTASRNDVVQALQELRALDLKLRDALHARQSQHSELARLKEECEARARALRGAQREEEDLEYTLGKVQTSYEDLQLRTVAAEAQQIYFQEELGQAELHRRGAEVRSELAAHRAIEARTKLELERDAANRYRKAEVLAAEERFQTSQAKRQAAAHRSQAMYRRLRGAQCSLALEAYCASRPPPVLPYVPPPRPRDLREPVTRADRIAALRGIPVEELAIEDLEDLDGPPSVVDVDKDVGMKADFDDDFRDGPDPSGVGRPVVHSSFGKVARSQSGFQHRSKLEAIRALEPHYFDFGGSSTHAARHPHQLQLQQHHHQHQLQQRQHQLQLQQHRHYFPMGGALASKSEAIQRNPHLHHKLYPSTMAISSILNIGRVKSHKEIVFLHATFNSS